MRRRNNRGLATSRAISPDLLGCFDKYLVIRRPLFEDGVSLCELAGVDSPVVSAGRPETLQFGGQSVELAGLLDSLAPLAERGGWTYYLHHHDNIAVDLARFEPYERAAFRNCLGLFRTCPAAEGGTNLLGVVGPRLAWVLVLENDNQGGFRADFFGSAAACRDLRSALGQSLPMK